MKEYIFSLLLTGCGDTPEEAFKDVLNTVVQKPPTMKDTCASYIEKPEVCEGAEVLHG